MGFFFVVVVIDFELNCKPAVSLALMGIHLFRHMFSNWNNFRLMKSQRN